MNDILDRIEAYLQSLGSQLSSQDFYFQVGFIALAVVAGWMVAGFVVRRARVFREEPQPGAFFRSAKSTVPDPLAGPADLARGHARNRGFDRRIRAWWRGADTGRSGDSAHHGALRPDPSFPHDSALPPILKWIGLPIAALYTIGLLDDVVRHLEAVSFGVGNIKTNLYAVARTLVFGLILFWLGRLSNITGKRVIRSQEKLDIGTREVIAKLFEISIYVLIFLLLLNVMGINLTALAVFGGRRWRSSRFRIAADRFQLHLRHHHPAGSQHNYRRLHTARRPGARGRCGN